MLRASSLLVDLVRSCPGIGGADRAFDAIKAGVAVENHWTITRHQRYHANGDRCDLPEDIHAPWHSIPEFPRHRTWEALSAAYKQELGPDHFRQMGCPLWHFTTEAMPFMEFDNRVVTAGLDALLNNSFNAVAGSVTWYVGIIGAGTGTVAITASAATVTGTSTSFANGDNGDSLIIVGAGASGADLITTVSGNPASTTSLTAANNASTTVSGASYALEPRAADTMASHSFNEVTPYSNANRPTWTKNGASSSGAMSNSSSKAQFTINATSRAFGAFMTDNNTKGGTTGVLYGGDVDGTNGSRSVLSGDTLNVQIDLSAITQ